MNHATAANAALASGALAVALWLRPWRMLAGREAPWPWMALCTSLPLFWAVDRLAAVAVVQPLSGAALLVLFVGWPLAMVALVPVAAVTAWIGDLGWAEGLHRLVWLGVVPATLTLGLGAVLRRWVPNHLFVYILGRGFLGTGLVCLTASGADAALQALLAAGSPAADELAMARVLDAFAEAFLTGMVVAISVAFRPQWLATYSDVIYLAPRPRA